MTLRNFKTTLLLMSICAAPCLTTGCSGEADPSGNENATTDASESEDPTAADPTETPVEEEGGIIEPSKTFAGELPEWCTGQPEEFSFFVTSMSSIWALSDSAPDDLNGGFGGNFQGIEGADSICQLIGIATGNGHKQWRAFLSATDDGAGFPVHAIDRIGEGPWYDANGRLVASDRDGLMTPRPDGDAQSVADLPDECGVPISVLGDAHDVPTGSNSEGRLRSADPQSTCLDWTSSDGSVGSPESGFGPGSSDSPTDVFCGHSFPRAIGGGGGGSDRGQHWMSDHKLRGCGRGANLEQNGSGSGECIGCTGGYGALYCFSLSQ